MRLFILALCVLPFAANAGNEWFEAHSSADMPALVNEGYKIVGFSTLAESSALMNLKVNRYLLQKDTSVYMCVEKLSASNADTMLHGCYALQ